MHQPVEVVRPRLRHVSTEDQRLDLQTMALRNAGCRRIFTDPGVSGEKQSRPGLDAALATVFLRQAEQPISGGICTTRWRL